MAPSGAATHPHPPIRCALLDAAPGGSAPDDPTEVGPL